VKYRQQIDRVKIVDKVSEIVLVDKDGSIYEGLSSNFFIIMNDIVYTSDIGIIFLIFFFKGKYFSFFIIFFKR
jgi:hypothetical protein